ncbi:MAG: hypothetical protein K4571_14900 [Deltaproteobacteria bacterium]
MVKGSRVVVCKRPVGEHSLPGYGVLNAVKDHLCERLVRTRMPGDVGAGGENPSTTRLCFSMVHYTFAKTYSNVKIAANEYKYNSQINIEEVNNFTPRSDL